MGETSKIYAFHYFCEGRYTGTAPSLKNSNLLKFMKVLECVHFRVLLITFLTRVREK